MDNIVNPQLLCKCKLLSTQITLKRFLSCVFPVVQAQVLPCAVLPLALLAAERLLSFVSSRVRLQLLCRGEPHQTALLQADQATEVSRCLVLAELSHRLEKLSTILFRTSHWKGHLGFSTWPKLTAFHFSSLL